jgi:hypothetical protein
MFRAATASAGAADAGARKAWTTAGRLDALRS